MLPEHAVHYLEIVTDDVAGICAIYSKAFGWQFAPPTPELGGARVASLPDGSRCGVRAPMHEQERLVVRTYIRVPDVERAAKVAEELGALVALPPMEIPGHGTIAIFIHGGIEQGVWQLP
jgi:predicted enzyme related to lactoylglutathione lyase